MARPSKLSRLRSSAWCAEWLGKSRRWWDGYWPQHSDLVEATRIVGKSRRWPEHVIHRHIETVCR